MSFIRRIVIISLLAVLLVGCGGQPATKAGFSDSDLYLVIAGDEYRLREDIDTVTAKLGEEHEYAEGLSCDYDGLDKTFIYPAAEFYTWPLEGDIVNEIYTESADVTTSKGITVGASKKDVLAAYGDGCEDTGWQLIYRGTGADSEALCFDLDGDTVKAISLTAQPI